ncbi:MAG TPA: helix-turn-helix domain-containing protein [Ktedonobacterales bacterium]
MIVMDGQEFMTAQEACTTLGIKPATLYAYVSRGLLASYRQGIKRMRLYRREDVERLLRLRGPDEHEPHVEDDDESVDADEDTREWIPYV